jgi:hypothetical protein
VERHPTPQVDSTELVEVLRRGELLDIVEQIGKGTPAQRRRQSGQYRFQYPSGVNLLASALQRGRNSISPDR